MDGVEIETVHGDSRVISLSDIEGLDRARMGNQMDSYAGQGLLWGGLAGVGVGGFYGVVLCLDPDSGCGGLLFAPAALGIAGMLIGAGVGAAVGAFIPREEWDAIPLGDGATMLLPRLDFSTNLEGGVRLTLVGELRFGR